MNWKPARSRPYKASVSKKQKQIIRSSENLLPSWFPRSRTGSELKMGMKSRLLPIWFRRRPEEARGRPMDMEEEHKRLIASLRPPRSRAPPNSKDELANEIKKRLWIDEQKRLIAEAMERAGGPDPRWNDRRKGHKAAIEELSASEIRKKWWTAEHRRSIAEDRLRSAFEADLRDGKFHPRVSTETAGDPAKRPVLPADSPRSIDAEYLMKSGMQKNEWGRRRFSEEYYAMRRKALTSFEFVIDESEKGAERRSASACAT
ncbi:unnamed protein product [Alopecurus aequalis]